MSGYFMVPVPVEHICIQWIGLDRYTGTRTSVSLLTLPMASELVFLEIIKISFQVLPICYWSDSS